MSENYKTIEYITLPPEKTEEGQPEQEAKTYEVADKTWRESPLFNIKIGDIIRWNRKGSGGGSNILDQDGKIEQEYLPSWVNNVLQFSSQEAFPQVGESDKIYIDQISNLLYRWNGNEYIAISSPPEEEEEEIEYTATSPIGIDTETNEIYHEDSGVTAGTYNMTFSKNVWYMPRFTVDDKGHITSASSSQDYIGVVSSSVERGLISRSLYNYCVKTPQNWYDFSGTSQSHVRYLHAGETTATWTISDPTGVCSYPGINNIIARDKITGEEIIVDWSAGISSDRSVLTVSIAQAYEHDIMIIPFITSIIYGH